MIRIQEIPPTVASACVRWATATSTSPIAIYRLATTSEDDAIRLTA